MSGATLERLQAELQDQVLHGRGPPVCAFMARGQLGVAERLAIYRHAYRARHAEALRDGFGHTAAYLGDAFDDLAARYLEAHPPLEASLRPYGGAFPEWLAGAHACAPVVAEVAALDRALRRAFDCADSPALGPADLAAVDGRRWGSAVLVLTRSYDRLRFEHNTLALWQAIDEDRPVPAAARMDRRLDVLVWRRGLQPHFRSLGALEVLALDHVEAGRAFGEVCEAVAGALPEAEVAAEAGRMLRTWVEEGLVAAID